MRDNHDEATVGAAAPGRGCQRGRGLRYRLCMRIALVVLAVATWSVPARADGVTGTWSGTIDLPGQPLGFSVTFSADGAAAIDIPAQGAHGLALAKVAVAGKAVGFEISQVGAVFKGTLDGDTIKGTLTQGGQSIPFAMTRGKAAPKDAYTPPPPPRRPLTAEIGRRLVGSWQGSFEYQGTIAIAVDFIEANGLVVGTEYQERTCSGTSAIANLSLTFDRVHFEVPSKNMSPSYFDGVLANDTISGTLHQDGVQHPFTVRRTAIDKPYTETELSIPSANGATLAATLTTPKGGPAPVVVLVTGSGPQDRDECVLGIRPFHQLADHLARHGVATLRYDDRGTARSTGDFAAATAADFADDAEAAVRFLATRTDVDPKKVGVLGHSEGGAIAPMIAARDKAVAFIVLWAGPGLPFDQIIIRQAGELARAEGEPADKIAHAVAIQQVLWKLMHGYTDRGKFKAAFGAAVKARLDKKSLSELGTFDIWLESQVAAVWTPWFRWYLGYDPQATLRKVTCPVLAINGALDKQVDAKQNLPAIKAALAHNKDVSIIELPGVNHVFQATKTGAFSEYAKNPPVMDASVLDATTIWIRTHTGLD